MVYPDDEHDDGLGGPTTLALEDDAEDGALQFSDMGTAFDMVARLNRRDFGHQFDWLRNPKRGWIAVKAEACRN